MKKIILLLILLFAIDFGYGQEIASFSSVANSACSGIISNNANISATGICRGPGITAATGGTYNSRNWTTTTTIDTNDYLEWALTPNSGYQIDLSTINISYDRSPNGPSMLDIQVDTGSGFASIFTDATVSDTSEDNNGIDLSSITGITGTITFRLFAFSSTGGNGTFDIEENSASNKGIIINGSVATVPCGALISWDSTTSSWIGGVPPTISDAVELNGDYNTGTFGSFSACSLTVNSGTLRIDDNTYVEIQNEITVDAGSSINVQPYGSVIQNDDSVTNINNGIMLVTKKTSLLAAWYEYTYWSSPVSGTTIQDALTDADVSRRFLFNAANFEDATMETGNNNATVPGQDDIDDNNDDWANVAGTTMMNPGVGYASTHEESVFIGPGAPPYQFDYIFTGDFNNGVITVPVVRNDGSNIDENWNFIGNPYPSAISVSDFFTQNMYDVTTNPTGTLEGAIYYWSQNTPPSGSVNGNQQLNFATSDYAIRNGVTGTAGGDGIQPNAFIPSGQGFFVSFAQARPSSSGDVIFNNSMRDIANDNSQFFKSSESKKIANNDNANKLWINLTSDNGVFNQIAIGYVNGATDNDDGTFYDAYKIVAPSTYASLYSNIENSNKKFAIQGKDINSINEDEVIKLGFKTIIDVATLYDLSLVDFQGNFLNNNTVYLKDNLLNQLHNLSASNYTFTSETGEFNARFEIVFNANALSTEDFDTNSNTLKIVELEDNLVRFTTSSDAIKTIRIYDLLGRQLYNLQGQSDSETYKLSNLSSAIYIAKVELSNGAIITKKAFKK